ncbi:MAG TPA: hypothetical protein VGL54_08500 [Solirubrobacteraceae bacterium]
MSFFDDGEETETASRPQARAPRPPRRPQPRRAQHGSDQHALDQHTLDQHTLMVRRRVAAGVGVVLLIVIVLVISGFLKGQQKQSLETYNRDVSRIAQESEQQVSKPFFSELADANSKSALDVENQLDQLHIQAQSQAAAAKSLSVPGAMTGAQRNLLLALDFRAEGVAKVAGLVRTALGGQAKQASTLIAGDMEIFLASDVIYSQRVAPLTQEALTGNGIQGQSTAASRFLPNIGWLEAATVYARLTGQPASSAQNGGIAPGTHGSALLGVSVGTTTLQPEPTLNHISGGGNPTITAAVENAGSNPETDVKIDVTVTAGGKQYKASHVIDSVQPGSKTNVEVPVSGVPTGVASKIMVYVEPVPGETNTENNKASFIAIFGE